MTSRAKRPTEDRAERTRRPFLEDESADLLAVEGRDPNYVYRWVNDMRGRVQRMIAAGYDIVTDGNHKIASELDSGSGNTITVNSVHGDKGVLMRIRKEYYEEDKAARHALINKKEEALFTDEREADGRYGKFEKT